MSDPSVRDFVVPNDCNASPRGVLGRARTFKVRALPAFLRGSRFAAGTGQFAHRVIAK
jgi:hypothetical protein